ncbi:GspE/PulE family protein [Halorhodospira neutriphila]|uniref:Bacterial type II secretion system protein E domain-containing protein n=1 Tax=Halorhodospira neutriphila TaxID=168379 RepID=A0ABS1E210_9GAMM|nr:GspE/PulE family protein [Halorhodospira neutriphila]MBK1725820.1 hypothetical protein [Halorhodospira neutriphila]
MAEEVQAAGSEAGAGRPIGQLLEQSGAITPEQVAYALQVQRMSRERLGDVLQRLRFVTDREVAEVLAQQSGYPFEPLAGAAPGGEVLRELPYNFAQRYELLPLRVDAGGRLEVAVSDPFDSDGVSRAARFTRYPLRLRVAPRGRLREQIQRLYYFAEHPIDDDVERIARDAQAGRNYAPERLMELLITGAVELGASDVHIQPTPVASLISYRIDGVLQLRYTLPPEAHVRLISAIKVAANMDIAEQNRPLDGRMSFSFLGESFDLRLSTAPASSGESMVLRLLSGGGELISLESVGFQPQQVADVVRMADVPYGLLLVTGPTGSGKSTTLYAALRKINTMEKNVLTIEDPVEYAMPLIRQVSVNERAGLTFASAIRSFLRHDPDVMLVGEVRDQETAQLTIRSAQTGHLVLSTLHTNDAAGAVVRMRDLGIESYLLSSSLVGVVSQRLVRKLCEHCRAPYTPDEAEREAYGLAAATLYRARGCERCLRTGYLGRVAVGEVLRVDDEIRALIDEGGNALQLRRLAEEKGMHTLWQSALGLVEQGVTDLTEVERVIR